MKRKQFKIGINAPPTEVYYKKMLGIHNKDTYNEWGKIFNPASTYEVNWKKGSKIAFTGTSKEGKPEGIFCIITKNIPNPIPFNADLRYKRRWWGNNQKTRDLDQWQNLEESYRFDETNGTTNFTVEVEMPDGHVEIFSSLWPKALVGLKSTIE